MFCSQSLSELRRYHRLDDARRAVNGVESIDEDGEYHWEHELFSRRGFWERYHDHDPQFVEKFWRGVKEFFPLTWRERRGDEPA